MPLVSLDHVNIRTVHLDRMSTFYEEVLGMRRGPRPPFPFGGAWLYCGDRPVVHLVDVSGDAPPAPLPPGAPGVSHFAFAATGLDDLIARLRAAGIPHRLRSVPGSDVRQVVFADPDGNDLHVDFAPGEQTA